MYIPSINVVINPSTCTCYIAILAVTLCTQTLIPAQHNNQLFYSNIVCNVGAGK